MMKKKTKVFFLALPLLLGILSLLCFALYFYSANTAPYSYIDVILLGPILSIIGVIISVFTRKSRKERSFLWAAGLISCLAGFAVCVFVLGALALFIRGLMESDF